MNKEIHGLDRARGERLLSERKRLGKSQPDAGAIIGVRVQAWLNYEKGLRSLSHPDLEKLHAAGFDVWFLITGERRSTVYLPEPEQEVLQLLAKVPVSEKATLLKMMRSLAGITPEA